jgi:hypothetical protein
MGGKRTERSKGHKQTLSTTNAITADYRNLMFESLAE